MTVIACGTCILAAVAPMWWLLRTPAPVLFWMYRLPFVENELLHYAVSDRLAYPDRWTRSREIGPFVLKGSTRMHLHGLDLPEQWPPGSNVLARVKIVDQWEWDQLVRSFEISFEVRRVGCDQSVWFSSFEHFGGEDLIAIPDLRCGSGVVELVVTEHVLVPRLPNWRTGVSLLTGAVLSRYRLQIEAPECMEDVLLNSDASEVLNDIHIEVTWMQDLCIVKILINFGDAIGVGQAELAASWTVDILADGELISRGHAMCTGGCGTGVNGIRVPLFQQTEIASLPHPESVRVRIRADPAIASHGASQVSQVLDLEVEFELIRSLRRDPLRERFWWHGYWTGGSEVSATIPRLNMHGEAPEGQ